MMRKAEKHCTDAVWLSGAALIGVWVRTRVTDTLPEDTAGPRRVEAACGCAGLL